jgi:hypothetical protein
MKIIPFGEVDEERFELSKRYNLIEKYSGIWRLTKKCRDNYEPISYIEYLTGKSQQPIKNGAIKVNRIMDMFTEM